MAFLRLGLAGLGLLLFDALYAAALAALAALTALYCGDLGSMRELALEWDLGEWLQPMLVQREQGAPEYLGLRRWWVVAGSAE